MAILENDIKLVASRVMDDVPEGGGSPTATVIADGASNAIFKDISEFDRAGGDVSLRKLFIHVQTDNTDTYLGSNVIVAAPPEDPNVSVTLFSTGEFFDDRDSASNRVESYLGPGSELSAYLLENHFQGQRALSIFSRVGATLPNPGETLVLRWHAGLPDEKEQYVRVTKITSEVMPGTVLLGTGLLNYDGLKTTVELSDALRMDFVGSPPSHLFTKVTGATALLATMVTDAATYCGCVPVVEEVEIGDREVLASSVFSQLVPSSQTENVVLDQNPAGDKLMTLATVPRLVQTAEAGHSQRIKVKIANRGLNFVTILTPLPSKLTVSASYRALGRWYTISDTAGDGSLNGSGGGTVSYLTGSVSITLQALPDVGSDIIFSWGANTEYTNRSGNVNFRAPEHAFQLAHKGIVPGSLDITWTSDSVIQNASDNGTGQLTGDCVGEINYMTGMVYIRPDSLIDAGGEYNCEYTWRDVVEEAFLDEEVDGAGFIAMTLAQTPVAGSVTVFWGVERQVSETSGSTSMSGNSTKGSDTKTSVAITNKVEMQAVKTTVWETVPDVYSGVGSDGLIHSAAGGGSGNSYAGNWWSENVTMVPKTTELATATTTKTESSSTGSHTMEETRTSKTGRAVLHTVTDNGAGSFIDGMGTVSYGAKTILLRVVSDWAVQGFKTTHENANDFAAANDSTSNGYNPGQPVSGSSGGSSTAKGGTWQESEYKEIFGGAAVLVRYCVSTATPQAGTTNYEPPGVVIDLAPYTSDHILPGSVQFTWMGVTYVDFEGVIYRNRTADDSGIISGTIDYVSGMVGMTDYEVGPGGFSLTSLWTSKGNHHTASVFFRTPVAPLKPGGLIFSVLDVSGNQIIATSNLDGTMSGSHVVGKIDYDTGVCEVLFGDYVLDSGLSAAQKAEWWYNVANVGSTGLIWKPWPVEPTTLRYNAVSYFYLPLDADFLGLDPVRLPQDGRVPIFRRGGFAVIGHTGSTSPVTVADDDEIDLGRVRLSRVRVIDDSGETITDGYVTNLEAGTVTFTDVTGYDQPIRIEHRIEDLLQVSDVEIGGRLSFTRPVTHEYPDGSYISSALIANDLKARVSVTFDQGSWNAVTWSDTLDGAAATGTYNDTLAPIEVTNRGAVTERWALRFTSSTAYQVIGEHVGVIDVGTINADCMPTNPATATPYFIVRAAGFGTGWSVGNIIRINTVGAIFPYWAARTVQQGAETVIDDSFVLLTRGDVDRP